MDYFEIGLSLATQGVYNDPPFDVTRLATVEDAEDAALLAAFKRALLR